MEPQPQLFAFETITSEHQLLAVAEALFAAQDLGTEAAMSRNEATGVPSEALLASLRDRILAGEDPLGDAFIVLRSASERRGVGATYTPRPIVHSMLSWAGAEGEPERIVDPGSGSGRFILAAARRFPQAALVAIELDPVAISMLRANAAVLGLGGRLTVLTEDYRGVTLPRVRGRTLFVGNPPYVRHHDISAVWKTWLAESAASRGLAVSKLAGLHVHFFLRTAQLGTSGDYGCFITSAEWLDVNYGSILRDLLADGLGGVSLHVLSPTSLPFEGTNTTGAITCFRVGNRPASLTVREVESVDELGDLSAGRVIAWHDAQLTSRWSQLVRPVRQLASGYIELGELFRVHRGQVTGANKVWIEGRYPGTLPSMYLRPTVTRAKELIAAGSMLAGIEGLKRVLDLPAELDGLDVEQRVQVDLFLAWARKQGAADGYIARHRRAWWSVGLREPASILVTYMARRAPAFVVNVAGARHINVAHGLYPTAPLKVGDIAAIAQWLRNNVTMAQGRTYAGGLTKFEPKEIERLRIPPVEELYERTSGVEPSAARGRRTASEGPLS